MLDGVRRRADVFGEGLFIIDGGPPEEVEDGESVKAYVVSEFMLRFILSSASIKDRQALTKFGSKAITIC